VTRDPVISSILRKVADCSREMWKRDKRTSAKQTQSNATVKETVRWNQRPAGLSMPALVRVHMQDPVPTLGVTSIEVNVVACIPVFCETEAEDSRLIAKVMRKIVWTSKSKKPSDVPYFYVLDGGRWQRTEAMEFAKSNGALPKELRLYGMMLAEAGFGSYLGGQIRKCIDQAVRLGFLTSEDEMEFLFAVERAVIKALSSNPNNATFQVADYDERRRFAQELMPQVSYSPEQVMATLSALDVIPACSLWEGVDGRPEGL